MITKLSLVLMFIKMYADGNLVLQISLVLLHQQRQESRLLLLRWTSTGENGISWLSGGFKLLSLSQWFLEVFGTNKSERISGPIKMHHLGRYRHWRSSTKSLTICTADGGVSDHDFWCIGSYGGETVESTKDSRCGFGLYSWKTRKGIRKTTPKISVLRTRQP